LAAGRVSAEREAERWRFDAAAGREELLNRRIGFNELATLESIHADVDAQKKCATAMRLSLIGMARPAARRSASRRAQRSPVAGSQGKQ